MTPLEAAAAILATRGRFFEVTFTPRTPGAEGRVMNCRLGVRRHLRGGPSAYDPAEHGLIRVYSFARRQPDGTVKPAGYRSIPIEGITTLAIAGAHHEVAPAEARRAA